MLPLEVIAEHEQGEGELIWTSHPEVGASFVRRFFHRNFLWEEIMDSTYILNGLLLVYDNGRTLYTSNSS